MRVIITAHSTMDVPHLACAGRFFPTKGSREVEVLDDDDDPSPVINMVPNPSTGGQIALSVPNQDIMGRKSYEQILKDGRFSVIQTGGVDARISGAEVAAARRQVAEMSAALADAGVEIAGKAKALELVNADLDAANTKIAALLAALDAAKNQPAPVAAEQKGQGESPPPVT